jgi:hypothetical protein
MFSLKIRQAVTLFWALLLGTALFAQSTKSGAGGKGSGGGGGQGQGGAQGSQGGGSAFFETQMLAYGSVNQLSEAIAKEVCSTIGSDATVVIFDQGSFQNLQAWQSFSASAKLLETAYKTLLNQDQLDDFEDFVNSAPKFGAGPFIGGAQDLNSLIATLAASTSNNASTFSIQDSTMAVSLAHQFKRIKKCEKVKPMYYPLFGPYANVTAAQDKLQKAIEGPSLVRTFIQTSDDFPDSKDDPKFLLLADLNTQYDQLLASVIAGINQSTGGGQGAAAPGVVSLLQGADLQDQVSNEKTYILYADVVAAGGTQRVRKNLVTVLFTGEWISYSGGLVVNVALTKSKGTELVFAHTLRYRSKFTSIGHPRESESVESTNAGDNVYSLCNQEKRHHLWVSDKPKEANCPVEEPIDKE